MTIAARQLRALRVQLDSTPWLRWALPVIGLLLLAFVWDSLDTMRAGAQARAMAEEVELRRIRALEGEDVWFSRADEATRVAERLRAELPSVSTSGLAQATLQSWLRDTAMAGLPPDTLRITVESTETVEDIPGVLRVRASMNGALSARQALGVIRQIESASNLIVIETVMIRSDQNPMFTATLNAYYRLQATEPAP